MSKSILVVDTPERCEECPLQVEVENEKGIELGTNICRGLGKYNQDSGKKPDWCPLRPVPEKKDDYTGKWEVDMKNEAWNACIDAIGGGDGDNR